jgi:class 3 adenylate cyclase/tetratricopeptide (TPR) repeat protein
VTELRRWLESRGREQLADLFLRRNIDFTRFLRLSEADLADLGLPPSSRRALLHEIEIENAAASGISTLSDRAERRQLTLMFCDLVDSVGLSIRLDPEDLRDLIATYQRACAQSVGHYDGYVARYMGDGILVYFGYPVAHEDDAERAIRAGLELVSAITKLNQSLGQINDLHVKVRIGIATGLVVVGDAVAEGVSDRDAVVGEAVNLAARLQAMAEPNTVVVSEGTRQLAPKRFEYRDLGRHELKGFITPVPVYKILGPREVTRLEARGTALTPFVGREDEIATLLNHWERASRQNGQFVVLVGQAGIGKSRIAAETALRIEQQIGAVLHPVVLQYSQHHSNVPLYPVVGQLTRLAGIQPEDQPPVKLHKLAELLSGDDPARQTAVSLVADLLGIEPADNYPPVALGPMVKRHLTIEALAHWFADLAENYPVMIVVEDAQWIDPTSQLLLARLANWAKSGGALIVITLRTDSPGAADTFITESGLVEPDGRYSDHVTVCEIRELNATNGRKLAEAAVANDGRALDPAQLEGVLNKSGGVPLYLEELAQAVASGVEISGGRGKSVQNYPVPSTLSDALMAQLDQLGFAKEVAQHASVIGPEFQLSLLAEIMGRSPQDLLPMINDLIDSRIVVYESRTTDTYRFKHALIRDVSYRSLLRKNRRQIHRAVAEQLARRPAETTAVNGDLIAQHYSAGEAHLEAIEFWRRGAAEAVARSANEEAIAMLQSALVELEQFRGAEKPAVELDLVLALAMALRSVRGYSAAEVEERLGRARELCMLNGDLNSRFSVEWGLFQCTFVKGDIEGARAFAADLLDHAKHDPGQLLVDAYLANGMVAFNAGEFEAAKNFHETGVALSRLETDNPRFFTHGQNAGLFCLSYLARTQCILGYVDQGRAMIERALAIAASRSDEPGHVHGHLNAAIHAVRVYHLCGDLDIEKRLANETIEIAQRNRYAYYEALAKCHLGWVVGAAGNLEEGIETLIEGLAALRQTGTALSIPGFHCLLSQLFVRADRLEKAQRQLALASGLRGFALWDTDIERTRGDIFARQGPAALSAAEAAYRSSLAIARRQRSRLLACKAGLSLARLLQSHGRHNQGYELLRECLVPLEEGDDVKDLRQARAMMAELALTL